MLHFAMKSHSLPAELPLTDIYPLSEYIGTSSSFWKIYRTKLISTGTEVSVFVFDKVACNKFKQQRKRILKSVWRHVDMIQNIQKYSSVTLKVILSAKENRKYVAYATEPVIGSLSNVMGDYPSDISAEHMNLLEKISLCEMEIKYGVVTIAETLSYLHLYESMIHCDVSPRNIVVCSNGSWRLSGFHFVMRTEAPHQLEFNHKPDAVTSDFLQPDINFCAPCLLMGVPNQESDIFSLGMLITYVYNKGISLIQSTASTSVISQNSAKDVNELYDKRISCAYNAIVPKIPAGLRLGLSKIISFDEEVRPTAQQLLMLGYYHDPLIKHMKRINLYENLPELERVDVLSTELPECAKHLPQRMLFGHVVPILTRAIDGGNRCAGVIQTLVTCLDRSLTFESKEHIYKLMNKILVSDCADIATQPFTILMEHIQLLYNKSVPVTNLQSPIPLLLLGLADTSKVSAALSAVNQLSRHPQFAQVLTPDVMTQIKQCFDMHWRGKRTELCTQYIDSMLVWTLYIQDKHFSQDICRWLVKLVRNDLSTLSIAKRALMTMLSQSDSYTLTMQFIEKELSPSIERLVTVPNITPQQRQTLVQLARYIESVVATYDSIIENNCTPGTASSGSNSTTTTTSSSAATLISTTTSTFSTTIATNVATTSPGKRATIRRQTNTSVQPPELKTPPPSSTQNSKDLPTFSLVITKPVDAGDGPSVPRLSRSNDRISSHSTRSEAERRRKLFQMDVSPNRGNSRSFGELMADMDDRSSLSDGRKGRVALSKDNRASSLQVTKNENQAPGYVRRSSLQPEHYQNLGVQARRTSIGTHANRTTIEIQARSVSLEVQIRQDSVGAEAKRENFGLQASRSTGSTNEEQLMEDQNSTPKVDKFMKSMLQRLNSLTAQFNSKAS